MSGLRALLCGFLIMAGTGVSFALTDGPVSHPPVMGQNGGVKTSALAETLTSGEKLTLERAVEIARQRQSRIVAAQGAIAANQSKVGLAKAGYYPQIDGAASYKRWSPGGTSFVSVDNSSHDQYALGVTANQMLYDFGKVASQVAIQKSTLDSVRADLATVEEQVIFNVKLAYFDMLKAARNIEVATETVKQFEEHLIQAKGFFEAGLKPKYDVTKAEVDLSNARLNLIRMKNGLSLARVVLNNAMGFPDAPNYEVADNLRFSPFSLAFEAALEMAFDHRPDLKGLLLKKRAAEQSVELARKGDLPHVSGNASTTYSGETLSLNQGWNVGVGLSLPIFNGYQTKHQTSEARANVDILAAQEVTLRQAIHRDVQQGYLNLQEAEERISATKLAIQQAEENFAIASGRYDAGVGAPVEITDAYVMLIDTRTNHIQALYDYRITQTIIEQAIGNSNNVEY